jgi:hypothetical protein
MNVVRAELSIYIKYRYSESSQLYSGTTSYKKKNVIRKASNFYPFNFASFLYMKFFFHDRTFL